jgi:hypothetical protein
MTRRRNNLKRRAPFRNPKPKIIIVSEGKLTEPDYFYALARSCGALVSFDIIIEKAAGVPMSIANKAIDLLPKFRRMTTFSQNDTVWAVFDRDKHPHFDEAINAAETAGVKVAFSNPCFELWLTLHFKDWDKPMNHHAMQKELKKLIPSYDPSGSKRADFSHLADKVSSATRRAKILCKRRIIERSPRGNPVTTVFYLVEHIQKTKP